MATIVEYSAERPARRGGLMRLAGNGKVWKKQPKKGIILSGIKWSRSTESEGC